MMPTSLQITILMEAKISNLITAAESRTALLLLGLEWPFSWVFFYIQIQIFFTDLKLTNLVPNPNPNFTFKNTSSQLNLASYVKG